jgi:molybdate transport system ATP-binding protein
MSRRGAGAVALTATVVVDERDVEVEVDAAAGETLAIVGANGAGKTTVVEAIAGLVVPDAGAVRLGDRVLHDRAITGRTWTPAHRRRVGLLDQRPLLFGGRTVLDAVAFPVRAAGRSRADARAAARLRLAEVGLAGLADAEHDRISGGQAQRVAFARVLASEPELLVLDEPFGALDAASAEMVRALVRVERGRRTTLLITHDPLDVIRLADRVLVLDGGRVVERGEVAVVLGAPRSDAARAFTRSRVVAGAVRDGMLEVDGGALTGARIPVGAQFADGTRLVAGIGPDGLVLAPPSSPRLHE